MGASVVSALALIPFGYIVLVTVSTGLATIVPFIARPRVADLLINTVALLALAVPLTTILGVTSAWLVERTSIPARRILAILLAAPLVIPAFVTSYGWVTVRPSLAGLPAGVLIASLAYYPLIYLPVAATLRRLDPGLEEVAASLGRGPWSVFRRVVLPQLRLPILGGGLLVGLHLLAEYGAFAMVRFETFTTAIVQLYNSTYSGPGAASLAGVLVVLCLLLLVMESAARGRTRFARIGSGSARRPMRVELGRWRWPAAITLAGLVVLAVGVPMSSVVRWLVRGGVEVWTEAHILPALAQSLAYGLAGAAIAVLLAAPIAVLAVRYPSGFSRLLEGADYVASSLPAIVVALALGTLTLRVVPPLYQTVATLILAYVLLFLPRALINLRSGIAQVPVGLEEVARSLGSTPTRAFLRVTARMATPAALAGGALVFLGVVNELTATLLLGPNGTRTLPIQFWTHVNDLDYAQAAPYALLMVVLSVPMVFVLFRAANVRIAHG